MPPAALNVKAPPLIPPAERGQCLNRSPRKSRLPTTLIGPAKVKLLVPLVVTVVSGTTMALRQHEGDVGVERASNERKAAACSRAPALPSCRLPAARMVPPV